MAAAGRECNIALAAWGTSLRDMAAAGHEILSAYQEIMKAYRRPGLALPPGLTAAVNSTGRPEAVAKGYWRATPDGRSMYWVADPSGGTRPGYPHGGSGSTGVVHYGGGGGKSNAVSGSGGAGGGNGSSTVAGGGAGGPAGSSGSGGPAASAHVIGAGAGLVQWGPGYGVYPPPAQPPQPRKTYPQQPPKSSPELRTAPGSVTGYRWWTLSIPDLRQSPAYAEEFWPHGLLYGAQDYWQPGVNTASCQSGPRPRHPADEVPSAGCHCGFWAYWQWKDHNLGRDLSVNVPVFGVIEGWGRFRRGPYGFRVQYARILALHVKATLVPEQECQCGNSARSLLRRNGTYTARPGRCTCPVLTPAQQAAAEAHAEAWLAVIGDRLETDYGVRVFETRDALLADFPADPVYGPLSGPACPACHEPGGLAGHAPGCPRHL